MSRLTTKQRRAAARRHAKYRGWIVPRAFGESPLARAWRVMTIARFFGVPPRSLATSANWTSERIDTAMREWALRNAIH